MLPHSVMIPSFLHEAKLEKEIMANHVLAMVGNYFVDVRVILFGVTRRYYFCIFYPQMAQCQTVGGYINCATRVRPCANSPIDRGANLRQLDDLLVGNAMKVEKGSFSYWMWGSTT